jgi:hypothetical protein
MQNEPPFRPPPPEGEGAEQYRLYFLRDEAHFSRSHEFYAADDVAAIKLAEGWREGRTMELWSRDRMVKAWR